MKSWKTWALFGVIVLLCVTGGFLLVGKQPDGLPTQTTAAASDFMQVYYYDKSLPGSFELVKDTVSLSGGILTFQLQDSKNQKVTIVEQGLPQDLHGSEVLGSEKVDGALGSATVNYKEGRAIGVLLTKDKQTMITINSDDSIDTSVMKDLLRSLRPI